MQLGGIEMAFVTPSWFSGILIWMAYIIMPLILGIVTVYIAYKSKSNSFQKISIIILTICILLSAFGSGILWHYQFEVPSVQEKTITVSSWQPKAGIEVNENGLMVIDSADDLMMITSDGEGFLNNENFLFSKFNTRDIYNQLKVNGTYKIKFYGWREGFNNGFPNILSVEEVIDESHAHSNNNFGNSIVQGI